MNQKVGLVQIKQSLDYVSAEYVYQKILKFVHSNSKGNDIMSLIIIDGIEISTIDYTVAKVKQTVLLLKFYKF